MRLTGPLNLTLDGPPELGFYASGAHGGFLAFDVFEIVDGAKNPRAEGDAIHPPSARGAPGPRGRRVQRGDGGEGSDLDLSGLD